MKRTLLSLAIMALAGAAQAQTSPSVTQGEMAKQPAEAKTMSGPPANEAAAKELILRDGYTEVGELKKADDGTWTGTAMRGDKEMQVKVDKEGKVSP